MVSTCDGFAALLARARQGDPAALVQLTQQYAGIIRRTAHALLGRTLRPHLDSVDLVQSVHRTLLIGLRREKFAISSPGELIALTVTLVRRKIARHWRSLKKQADTTLPQDFLSAADPASDPAAAALVQDQIEHLLRNLEEVDRRLLELRLQGYSTAEVARELGLDPGFLRVRLGRVRKRLRDDGLLDDWL